MSQEKNASRIVRTPPFRMYMPNLITPRPYMEKGKQKGDPKYSVQMMYLPEDLDKFSVRVGDTQEYEKVNLKNVLVEIAKEEWPDLDLKEAQKYGGFKWPLKNGDAECERREKNNKKGDALKGYTLLNASTSEKFPPQLVEVVDRKYKELDRSVNADVARAKELFTAGYWAKGVLNIRASVVDDKKFLTPYINGLVFVRKDQKIGGISAEDRFGGIEGGESETDPTDGVDDEIPF